MNGALASSTTPGAAANPRAVVQTSSGAGQIARQPRRISLAAKFTLATVGLLVALIAVVTVLSVQREGATFRRELETQATLLLDVLATSSENALYLLDVDALTETVSNLAETGTNIGGRLYDADGRLVADSASGDTPVFSTEIDPFAGSLIAREAGLPPLFVWSDGELLAGRAVRIGRQIIGAVAVTLPTTALADKTAQVQTQGLIVGGIAAVVGIVFAFILSRYITQPLRQFTQASTRVSGGDYTATVRLRTRDEFNDLAVAFNTMTGQIRDLVGRLENRARELEIANERAHEASRLKSEFLATMSHELRTPLNAIIGFSDMLLMGMHGDLNEKQRHKIARSQENGKRLLRLVNDILDIARIEAGRVDVLKEPFAPRALAGRLAAQVASLAEEKGLQFETEIDPALPPALIGDEKHLEQVVVNLLSNAFKFTEVGSVTLRLGLSPEKAGDGGGSPAPTWTIAVQDTGVGIPPHALDLIFDEFRQVDGSSQRAYKGSGLGLAITRHLVRVMDGKIRVESTLGQGSTFTVTLPLIVAEGTGDSAEPFALPPAAVAFETAPQPTHEAVPS